jgi:hypothetical protein
VQLKCASKREQEQLEMEIEDATPLEAVTKQRSKDSNREHSCVQYVMVISKVYE